VNDRPLIYPKLCLFMLVALSVLSVSVTGAAAKNGRPDGQGADACHLLYAGGLYAGGVILDPGASVAIGGTEYNVGNPGQVLIAGDCDGGPISFIDDGLSLTVSTQTGASDSATWNFYDYCGGHNLGSAALDVTDLFKPGTNTFALTLDNDCGGWVYAPTLYLVVRQQTN
jgi:hypothetical protein